MARDILSALTREYSAGSILFEEHDPGSRMYIIRSGRVKIFRETGEREIVLAFLTDGDFFGEMALLEGLPRSASAVAVDPTILLEVDAETFEEMISTNMQIAVRMMRRLASRVRQLDERISNLMVENNQGRAVEVLRWLLPQGVQEEQWVRIREGALHLDIAMQAGLPAGTAEAVVSGLVQAKCVRMDDDDLLIAKKEVLDNYATYLELNNKYGSALADDQTSSGDGAKLVRKLVQSFSLTDKEVENQQEALAEQYARFVKLKKRFKNVEPEK